MFDNLVPSDPSTHALTNPGSAPELARAAGINALTYLSQRGFVQNVTDADGLAEALTSGSISAYVGFDPTASSLHVGNLVGIMLLASLQRFGHCPIALGGGGTALIGDPSGKTTGRRAMTQEEVASNLASILPQFGRYLDFAGGDFGENPPAQLVNNADWLLPLHYISFLREIGSHFSVNEMLAADTYKLRLETGLNFVEFNYRLLQSYDFLHLYRTAGCVLQMGGSDQWGNILAGIDLIRRVEGQHAYGLVTPLITTSSGAKMGKTEAGAIWLDPVRTPPFEFYQFWINTEDDDARRFLRLYTFLPDDQIDEVTTATGAALREAKELLAFEATALSHGRELASAVRESARALYKRTGSPDGDATYDLSALPLIDLSNAANLDTVSIAELCVRSGLCVSRREARTLALQGGLSVDGQPVTNADQLIATRSAIVLLRAGKKRYRRVRLA